MKVDTWDYVTLLRKWLDTDAAPTTLEDARLLRVLKISEELGAEALHGVLGANPRKGASHGWGDVAKERGRHRDGHDRAGHGQRGRRGCGEAAAPGPHGGRAGSGRGYRPGPRDQRGHEAGRHRRVRGAGHWPAGRGDRGDTHVGGRGRTWKRASAGSSSRPPPCWTTSPAMPGTRWMTGCVSSWRGSRPRECVELRSRL